MRLDYFAIHAALVPEPIDPRVWRRPQPHKCVVCGSTNLHNLWKLLTLQRGTTTKSGYIWVCSLHRLAWIAENSDP